MSEREIQNFAARGLGPLQFDADEYGIIPPNKDLPADSDESHIIHQSMYNATTVPIPEDCSARYQVIGSLVASSFHVVVGFALALSAVLIPQLESSKGHFTITPAESSWFASCLGLTVPIGALLSGILMERWGRLFVIKLAAVPCVLGWIFISSAHNFPVLLIGRLLTGFSAGLGTSPCVVYITEVVKPKYRGALVSMGPTLVSLGMVFVYVVGYFFTWRSVGWISTIAAIGPVIAVAIYIPESPVWLVAQGKVVKAKRALRWYTGNWSMVDTPDLLSELERMISSQDLRILQRTNFRSRMAMFLRPTGFKPMFLLIGLFFFQQNTGVYITLFYATTFFEDVGINMNPAVATIVVGCVRLAMSLLNMWIMKHWQRRPLMIISGIGMAVCMGFSGSITRIIHLGSPELGWIPVVCILIYVCFSMIGVLSIPWSMTAELFPTPIRGMAQGIIISIAWVFMFIAVHSYRFLLVSFGGAHTLQWYFAVMSLASCVFVWLFMPETHNKTLAEIEKYFQENTIYIMKEKPIQVVDVEMGEVEELPVETVECVTAL